MPYVPIPREKVLEVIERAGPVQPLDLRRETGGDTVLIGAVLSEMVGANLLLISKTKRGGSPFYYLPSRPESLEPLHQYLGEKDRRTYATLKEEQVLREVLLDPLTRVSLGNIPDFSRRFEIEGEHFWRYYLLPEEEAVGLAKERFGLKTREELAAEEALKAQEAVKVAEKAPERTSAEEPKKARRPRRRAAKKVAAQQTVEGSIDPLYEKVKAAIGPLLEVEVRRPETEIVGVHAGKGPHGDVHTLVWASTKRVTEKQLLKALLEARGRGMPLLALAADMPKKAQELVDETPNVHWRSL